MGRPLHHRKSILKWSIPAHHHGRRTNHSSYKCSIPEILLPFQKKAPWYEPKRPPPIMYYVRLPARTSINCSWQNQTDKTNERSGLKEKAYLRALKSFSLSKRGHIARVLNTGKTDYDCCKSGYPFRGNHTFRKGIPHSEWLTASL